MGGPGMGDMGDGGATGNAAGNGSRTPDEDVVEGEYRSV